MTTPVLIGTPLSTTAALQRMSRRLTVPFAPGADTLTLDLRPGANSGSAVVAGYDFTDHLARFEIPADPTYVLRTLVDIEVPISVTLHLQDPGLAGGGADLQVTIAAGSTAGDSVVLTLPSAATTAARITDLSAPAATTIPAEQRFSVLALLGNTARLLWVLAAEREQLRRTVQRTAAQRRLETATGSSLDLIGADLAVPRFPPLPHTFDADTTALYHLDDVIGAAVAAEDFTGRFPGRTAHPGVLWGAVTMGAAGRFGTAAGFTGPGSVTIASDPVFDIAAAADFTAECFVVPDPTATDGTVLGRGAGGAGTVGWNIAIGNFGRGRDRSVRAVMSDGTTETVLYGDLSLPTDQFTHLAMVLDRGAARVLLFVGGVQTDAVDAGPLTAIASAQDLLIGPGATGFQGRVDEVRLSGVARRSFSPVLGEADDHYRRRLALFRRWVLPTPSNLAAALNGTVGQIGGLDDPLLVDDTDSPMVRGTHTARVVPVALAAGSSISADGGRDRTEADLYPDDADTTFNPAFLTRHDVVDVDYGPANGPIVGDAHLMQAGTAAALDSLLTLLGTLGIAGRLRVGAAWPGPGHGGVLTETVDGIDLTVPLGLDALASGRSLTLTHDSLTLGRLAALAHRAGFDLVTLAGSASGVVANAAPGGIVTLTGPGTVLVGASIVITAGPAIPPTAQVSFRPIIAGPGQAALTPVTATSVQITGGTPGVVVVGVDVLWGGLTVTTTTSITVQPNSIPDGGSIGPDGTFGAGPEVAGPVDPPFEANLLANHNDPRATYSGGPDAHLMQRGVARRLNSLLDLLAGQGILAPLDVAEAYRTAVGAPDLASCGRSLTVSSTGLPPTVLGALAHQAGFTQVAVAAPVVMINHRSEELIEVDGPDVVEEGASIPLTISPDPATVSAATRLSWSSGGFGSGAAGVTTTTATAVALVGQSAGPIWAQAVFRDAGATGPYAATVRLRPELAGATISRDQYDLVMNTVHALYPIGVEILTRELRAAVVELAGSPDVDPEYTYPQFRLHRPAARLRKDSAHG